MAAASHVSGLEIPFLETEPVSGVAPHRDAFGDEVLPPGSAIAGRYRVLRKIGEGGMGILYACTDTVLTREVAVKLMRRSLAADPLLCERLLREARLAAQLHSHVAQVFDCGALESGEPYIVMELLSGRDLYTTLRETGPLSPETLCSAMLQVCVGLVEAHEKGIIHRDLKPENLFCATEPDGSALLKIVDFGVSKQITTGMRSMTNPTESVGSPQYMSPEQITTPSEVDPRTDVWSLGIVMYELLTGALPFNGPTPAQVCAAVLSDSVPPISDFRDDVPQALEFIVRRCLERNRERRFSSVAELSKALQSFVSTGQLPVGLAQEKPARPAVQSGALRSVRPRRRWLGVLLSIAVLGGCFAVLSVGVRDRKIHLPSKAEVLQLPARASALRAKLGAAFDRQRAADSHSAD
ncbi:MAG: serine/threonine-protein kinase [Pseudomonadota bacterium]